MNVYDNWNYNDFANYYRLLCMQFQIEKHNVTYARDVSIV